MLCIEAITRILNIVSGVNNCYTVIDTLQEYLGVISTVHNKMERQLKEMAEYAEHSTFSQKFKYKFLQFKVECDIYEDVRNGFRNWFHSERIVERFNERTISCAIQILNSMLTKIEPLYEKSIEIEPKADEIYRLFISEKTRKEYPIMHYENSCCCIC